MKSKFTQRRYRAPKRRACGLCKPQKQGWDDKKTFTDLRRAVAHEQEIRDWEQGGLKAAEPAFEFWNNPEDAIYDQL